jgi:hypothetical protein
MKINLPISKFKFENNRIYVNDLIVEYENVSEDTQEILESLISKGAYGSALLTLNMFYNVKSFNEAAFTHSEYLEFLSECNKLLEEKECLVEASEALSFKPLINLKGLEIMESDNYIARGKNNKLFIEDFRLNEECEGTQCSDIAEKKDQEVGSLQKPKKRKKLIVKENNVPRNHGFKGFMMCESGFYERGKYALIKEGKKIKAVRKDSLGI